MYSIMKGSFQSILKLNQNLGVIIQVSAPTTSHCDEQVESMYEDTENFINEMKGDGNLFIMGDMNAIVGEGKEGVTVGKYGIG